jgi:multiple sugar transport system permease protein
MTTTSHTTPMQHSDSVAFVRAALGRIGRYVFIGFVIVFFALPVLWLVTAPFDRAPALRLTVPEFTLQNFRVLLDNPFALRSLGNSVIISLMTMAIVLVLASLAAYALSRVRVPGRDLLLYSLLLLSSIVTGTAAMVPIFVLITELRLMDTYLAVVLVMAGGLLPAAIFILKDFMDNTPRSYEESARVYGASSMQILRHVAVPIARPGLATIAVWSVVQVWGNFLIPFILLRSTDKFPAAVIMFTFYTEGGQPNLALISAFSLLFSIPVVLLYVFVNRRYGFRFYGGTKS